MLSEAGLLLRAAYRALPGYMESAGRAERFAVYTALKLLGDFDVLCTDLFALRDEGNAVSDDLDGAAGAYATIWRQIKAVAGQRRPYLF
eukprot:890888-Pyramimonas_sp.AAC.1